MPLSPLVWEGDDGKNEAFGELKPRPGSSRLVLFEPGSNCVCKLGKGKAEGGWVMTNDVQDLARPDPGLTGRPGGAPK